MGRERGGLVAKVYQVWIHNFFKRGKPRFEKVACGFVRSKVLKCSDGRVVWRVE